MPQNKNIQIFISHSGSNKDLELLDQLDNHLSVLERVFKASIRHVGTIMPGTDEAEALNQAIQDSQIMLVLVSSDFFESDRCFEQELPKILDRHGLKQGLGMVVLCRPCLWEGTGLESLAVLPKNKQPIQGGNWPVEDLPYVEVSKFLRKAIVKLRKGEPLFEEKADTRAEYEKAVKEADHQFAEGDYEKALIGYVQALTFFQPGYQPAKEDIEAQVSACKIELPEEAADTPPPAPAPPKPAAIESKSAAPKPAPSSLPEFEQVRMPRRVKVNKDNEKLVVEIPYRRARRWFGVGMVLSFIAIVFSLVLIPLGSTVSPILFVVGIIILLGPLYFLTARLRNKYFIEVDKSKIEVSVRPHSFLFGKKRSIAVEDIEQVYCKKFSDTTINNEPVYDYKVSVISKYGDEFKLIRMDNAHQAFYLEQEIEGFLGIEG